MKKLLNGVALFAALAIIGCNHWEKTPEEPNDCEDITLDESGIAAAPQALETTSPTEPPLQPGETETCRCGNACPFPNPPAECADGERVVRTPRDCDFTIACDGVIVECSIPVHVESCEACPE